MAKYIDGKTVVSGGSSGFSNMQNPINVAKLIKQATEESPEYKIQSGNISYDNAISGLVADTVKDAIDELQDGWQYLTIDLLDTDILGMGSLPIELLPVAGANSYYVFDLIKVEYTPGTTAYTYPDPKNMLKIVGANGVYMIAYMGASLSKEVAFSNGHVSDDIVDVTKPYIYPENENSAIFITTHGNADWTLGDGTIKVKLKYKIETFG